MTEIFTTPEINTALPGPKAQEIIARDEKFLSTSCYREYPFVLSHGKGSWLWDVDGNRFLDFMAGIATCSTGHAHPDVVKAIQDQAEQFLHICSMDFYFDLQARFAERLTNKTQIKGNGKNRIFFANSGAEAWEGAIKLARYKTKRPNIICFYGAFHGRTYGGISSNASKVRQKQGFGPLLSGIYHAFFPTPYNCPHDRDVPRTTEGCIRFIEDYLFGKMVAPSEVAAIALEPIQGEGGYIVPPADFMVRLRELCDKHGILLIADEIQSGYGRTGKFFAMEHFNVKPDIVCIAKGIASGLPLSAFVANEEVMDWPVAVHGSTFGGNPVAMAAAEATLNLIEGGLMDNAAVMGPMMLDRLKKLVDTSSIVGDARGLGLMIGVDIVTDKDKGVQPNPQAREKVIQACFERGLLMLGCGSHTIRFCPPLSLSHDEAMAGLDIFEQAVRAVERGES